MSSHLYEEIMLEISTGAWNDQKKKDIIEHRSRLVLSKKRNPPKEREKRVLNTPFSEGIVSFFSMVEQKKKGGG